MIAISAIRSTLETAIDADDTFSSHECIVDDGYQNEEILTALRDDAVVVLIGKITSIIPQQQAVSAGSFTVNFPVFLALNPSVNADKATPLVMDTLLATLLDVILGIAPDGTGDNDRYRVGGEGVVPVESDMLGPYCYAVHVTKGGLVT